MRASHKKAALAVASAALLAVVFPACTSESSTPAPTPQTTTTGGASYREPVKLSSKDGVLEVRLTAQQGTVPLDTVAEPVTNFLVFGYEVIKGTASNGQTKADDVYPSPTLRVDPGQRLVVHLENDLRGLTIDDYYDPAVVPKGQPVPEYRPILQESPINLHTHGLHVSPDGNADNVLLDIPAGMANTYDYAVPDSMPHGMYWYHSHRHTLTAQQTYMGLAGLLEIGRPDGNLPAVTQNELPIRTMALQYNTVYGRGDGGHQLNQPNFGQFVSTLTPPEGTQLADGTYEPTLAPRNFEDMTDGTQFFTNWYAGPLSPHNHRGQSQFVPQNLSSFTSPAPAPPADAPTTAAPTTAAPTTAAPTTAAPTTAAATTGSQPPISVPANPAAPDAERDVQYTINGQFQPTLTTKPGQTEIWVLANISDFAYLNVTLTETATGNHPKIVVVGQDGNPFPEAHDAMENGGTTLLIPPGSRYAIAVTMPTTGDLILEMPADPKAKTLTDQAILYTNNGTDQAPAVLGEVTLDKANISYFDGFFAFPTQVLARVKPESGQGRTVPFVEGQKLDAYTSFVETQNVDPDVKRTLEIHGGFNNKEASTNDPLAFTYDFDAQIFPYVPLIQPRLDSVEEWTITNYNNDGHPIHIHVNDFQVMQITDPQGATTGVQMWGEDNVNLPAAEVDEEENPIAPGSVTLRTKFEDYSGTYVIHCHRLNHEDQGLMAIINVIPAVSSYAVAVPGSPGTPATVRVLDGSGDGLLQTVTPFPAFEGTPTVAMGHVDGDQVLDVVIGTGPGVAPEVVAYSGTAEPGGQPFQKELARFAPFPADFRGGVNVAAADIDGNALLDNIVVGSGPGMASTVNVYATPLPALGTAPELFSTFKPYDDTSGVSVATGLVDAGSGRPSIVTAPGPGSPARVKSYRYDLYAALEPAPGTTSPHAGHDPRTPIMTSEFLAFDESYTGGVSLATGWVAGAEGGVKSIITGQLAAPGAVRVYSSGSSLDGSPTEYTHSPNEHGDVVAFREILSFSPFGGAATGVHVATTSTTVGADLVVSGPAADGTTEVQKYTLVRNGQTGTTLTPNLVGPVTSVAGPAPLGGA